MASLYKFDKELKKIYPNLNEMIDSKVAQELMEMIIEEEPSIDFIKSYLEEKGYNNIDSDQKEKPINEIDTISFKIDSTDAEKDSAVSTISTDVEEASSDSEEIEEFEEDDFDLDKFLMSDDFKADIEKTKDVSGFKNNTLYLSDYSSAENEDEKMESRNKLMELNLPLVRKVATKYLNAATGSLVYDDLVSEGTIGMVKAIDRFELEYGYEFSTYAYNWIAQSITRAIADKSLMIRLPVHLHERLNKINKIERELSRDHNRIDAEKVAFLCEITVEKYLELKTIEHRYRGITSLNIPISEDGEQDLQFMLNSKDSIWYSDTLDETDPLQIANFHALQEGVNTLLATLTEKEEKVIRLRYGFDGQEPLTLEEIGKMMNVTRERIRQIQAKALRKLQVRKQGLELDAFMSG